MQIITTEEGLAVLLRSPCCDSQFVLGFGETTSIEIPYELKCPVCGLRYDVEIGFRKRNIKIDRSKSDAEKVLEIAKKYGEDAEVFPCRALGVIEVTGIEENRRNTFLSRCFEFVSSGVSVHCVDEVPTCNIDFCTWCVQEEQHD